MSDEGDFITIDGKDYVRVSAVIKGESNIKNAPKDKVKKKSEIGTEVHDVISDFLKGGFPIDPSPEADPYFQSFLKWKQVLNFTVVQHSTRYRDENLMLTGELDNLIKIPSEEFPLLVDYKCSATESPTWELQAHGYDYLLDGFGIHHAKRFLFVKLDPKGALPKIFTYSFSENSRNRVIHMTKEFWEKNPDIWAKNMKQKEIACHSS